MASSSSHDNGRRLPPLAPAPVGASPQQLHHNQARSAKAFRVPRVGACSTCRTRKIKCNGVRPTCDKCTVAEIPCVYSETESREARRKYSELRDRRNTHEEMIEILKSLPETDALDVLRQLKSGGDVKQILDQTKDGELLMQLSSTRRRDSRCALSFIADLPDASNAQDHESSQSSGEARRDSESVTSTTGSTGTDQPTSI